ncbi:uncharacterized protein LOC110988188 isoform X2 [Acanthaster planci]|uniref:Uncharacterized protein LOC110988188 isoform X2 n=1 Tax=Acanthaster planci TaxID=133434 RepID=A0A8B7ZP35_ACAPL|nr:uncharacterized protein LOC110988188 isoform X2 [Acanthaster planci]
MLRVSFLCLLYLLLFGTAEANWGDGSRDPDHSHLGFVAVNMICNDNRSACGHCYSARSHGLVYLNVFEYTSAPYQFEASIQDGVQDWYWTFVQDDPSEPFRVCKEVQVSSTPELPLPMRAALCMDNDFSALSVPGDCSHPVVTVSMDTHFANEKINGLQTLYCLPQQA